MKWTTNCLRKRGRIVFEPSFLQREVWPHPWPPVWSLPACDESLPSASPTIAGRRHAHTHWTEQLQCLSHRCVRHVDVSTEELSLSFSSLALVPVAPCLVVSNSDKLFFFSLFPQCCSFTLSLCYTHSLLIWSSVGQRGSSESQECWQARLINEKWRGEELHWLTSPF